MGLMWRTAQLYTANLKADILNNTRGLHMKNIYFRLIPCSIFKLIKQQKRAKRNTNESANNPIKTNLGCPNKLNQNLKSGN